ncbi:MAG: DUF5330 domain-containing protein [Rhizobiales bacterium]|nr:DUF5330 domain-containing protein [Hyphomicrobiales bacterium]
MLRLIKICFWIAVVVMILPEDPDENNPGNRLTKENAMKIASAGLKDVSDFCVRNPDACQAGKEVVADLGEKTIRTARSIYEYLNKDDANSNKNTIESVGIKKIVIENKVQTIASKNTSISNIINSVSMEDIIAENYTQNIEDKIRVANTKGNTLSASDLSIDFLAQNIQ